MDLKRVLKNNRLLPVTIVIIIFISIIISNPVLSTSSPDAYNVTSKPEVLPYPYSRGSAVWVPEQEAVYIFGGRNKTAMLDRIMKYTPNDDKLTILDTRLPTVLMGSTSVYNGQYVYTFGGKDYDDFYNTILRFDPETETLINMSARLPNPTVGASAVWTGESIFFFGGSWGGVLPHKFDTILRFDPELDNITVMDSTLTYGRSGLAATWDGEFIYVVGGSDGKLYSNEVFKYDPKTDDITALPGKLPTGRVHIQAEYHKGSIYIFGGRGTPTEIYDHIIKYDLETNEVDILDETLPNPSELRMHAFDGKNIYIIGGFAGATDLQQFVVFDPDAEEPETSVLICPPDDSQLVSVVFTVVIIIVFIILLKRFSKSRRE
jgi:N-acetylneuraminic acid mutarotase